MKKTENYSEDEKYMSVAIELAKKGYGYTAPNPVVGAVIVKDGCIIGQGYHEKYGEPHAERNALASCSQSPEGATIYVTLEPCCHHGKQPPCTDAIIEAGISRVVTGSGDPNPLVGGKGIRILKDHGIQVTEHVLKEECDGLNPVFFHYIQTGLPLCDHEIRHDYGWKDRRLYRCFQMGDRGRKPGIMYMNSERKILGSWWGSVRYWQMILCLTAA